MFDDERGKIIFIATNDQNDNEEIEGEVDFEGEIMRPIKEIRQLRKNVNQLKYYFQEYKDEGFHVDLMILLKCKL